MSNVVEFPNQGRQRLGREVKPLSLEDFCIADAKGEWADRSVVNGMTILLYPNATFVCSPGGACTAVVRRGHDMDEYIADALAALCANA